MDKFIRDLWRGGLYEATLISIGISLALNAISYGLQALLAPKPPPIVGPRLDDLGPATTNTGRPIPKATGRNIVNGQVIWSTGLVEEKHTEKVKGGKGGGKTQKIITYTYSVSVAIAVNDGEICGINRILGNGAKTLWSQKFGTYLTEAEIDALGDEKFAEVFAEQQAIWLAVTDPVTGLPKYTAGEAEDLAEANALNAARVLINELEAANADVKPRYSSIEFYYGTETQNPSPTIEGYEGAGNVSAFRGIAYIVIADLELADFGNFTPSFQIDYATAGTTSDVFTKTSGADDAPKFADDGKVFVDWDAGKAFITEEDGYSADSFIHEYDLATQTFTQELSLAAATFGVTSLMGIDRDTGYLYGWDAGGPDFYWQVFNPATGTYITDAVWPGDQSNDLFGIGVVPWLILTSADGLTKKMMSYDPGGLPAAQLVLFYDASDGAFDVKFLWPSGFTTGTHPVEGDAGVAYLIIWSASEARIMRYTLSKGITEEQIGSFTPADIGVSAFDTSIVDNPEAHFDSSTRSLVFAIETTESAPRYWVAWDTVAATITWSVQYSSTVGTFNNFTPQQTRLNGGSIVVQPLASSSELASIDLATGDVSLWETNDGHLAILDKISFFDGVTQCFYMFQNSTASGFQQLDKYCISNVCFVDPVSLGDIIRNYMTRAGYAASEYEIDAAVEAETIWGFSDNSGRSTRDLLEDLARIRPVIVNEIEGKLRFRLADQSVAAVIPKADVRAYDGSGEPPEWINEVQTLEDLALPKTLRITYQDIDRALNPTTATFAREITQSTTIEEFTVQAVDTAEAMRNSVFTGMSVLMTGKRSFKLSVPLKYSVLEPGDVITIPVSDTRTAKARIAQATLGANNIVELECFLYIDTSLGIVHTDQFDAYDTDTAVGTPITTVFLLDTPYLTDDAEYTAADDTVEDNGIYVAFATTATQWPGVVLYVDQQTITTEELFGTITQATGAPDWQVVAESTASTFAGRLALLPDPTATALVQDIVSQIVVSFYTPGAAFETIASGSALSTQDNAFLVGNEIIQAQTVELLNTDSAGLRTYQFSDLWRGLQGTEWAIGTQAIGDQVVHLEPGAIQRVDLENADLAGLTLSFKGVTVNSDIVGTTATTIVYDAASRKPYAPMIEAVVRDDLGNLTFELIQRNRYGSLWTPTDPPFESDPDNFEVDIVIAGSPSPLRTIVVSGSSTISYTAAQQTTDFGAAQASIAVAAYQLNADGRRGFARQETI